jgi:hypothetical protein
MWGEAQFRAGASPPAAATSAAQKIIALRWWRQALPVAPCNVPPLAAPAAVHAFGRGETLEVHGDDTGTCRAVLVRRKGAAEEVRILL